MSNRPFFVAEPASIHWRKQLMAWLPRQPIWWHMTRWPMSGEIVLSDGPSSFFNSSPLTCDECRDLFDIAAGLVLADVSLEQELPGVARHVATCANCREELLSLVHVLRAASSTSLPHLPVGLSPIQALQVKAAPHEPANTWMIPVSVLTQRWLGNPLLAQARSIADQPVVSERRLLMAGAIETSWGLAGVEVTAQRDLNSPAQIEIQVRVAFDQPVHEAVRVVIGWADQELVAVLDESGYARFVGIALNSLFDTSTGQAKDDLCLSLSPAP